MKYIVTQDEDGKEDIFIFPKHINHDAMMEVLEGIRNQTHGNWERIFRKPIAAGFVGDTVFAGKYVKYCYGKSETLDLSSRPEDTELLIKQWG